MDYLDMVSKINSFNPHLSFIEEVIIQVRLLSHYHRCFNPHLSFIEEVITRAYEEDATKWVSIHTSPLLKR